MAQAKGGKHKMHRSSLKKNYYAAQFTRSAVNKARLAARRERRRKLWAGRARDFILKRRAALRGKLFGFHPHQIVSNTTKA